MVSHVFEPPVFCWGMGAVLLPPLSSLVEFCPGHIRQCFCRDRRLMLRHRHLMSLEDRGVLGGDAPVPRSGGGASAGGR
jgi:hypothetical protein